LHILNKVYRTKPEPPKASTVRLSVRPFGTSVRLLWHFTDKWMSQPTLLPGTTT